MPEFRNERDSMGEMAVPADALYGASTQRAVLNFPISGRPWSWLPTTIRAVLKKNVRNSRKKFGPNGGNSCRS